MLLAFVVTFAVTRVITNLIRRGRGPFRDMSVGGVHIHHQVWGIFLLLGVGTMELAYRPASPWLEVLAVLFGMGAALTLDEFALSVSGCSRLKMPAEPHRSAASGISAISRSGIWLRKHLSAGRARPVRAADGTHRDRRRAD